MHALMSPIINAIKVEQAIVMEIKHIKLIYKVETIQNTNLQLECDTIDAQVALAKVNADCNIKFAKIAYQAKK